MSKVTDAVAAPKIDPVAEIVTVADDPCVGIPVIAPVLAFSVSPAGKEPDWRLNATVPENSVAIRFCDVNGVPMVPATAWVAGAKLGHARNSSRYEPRDPSATGVSYV